MRQHKPLLRVSIARKGDTIKLRCGMENRTFVVGGPTPGLPGYTDLHSKGRVVHSSAGEQIEMITSVVDTDEDEE